ncbi:M20/M25/M40 family metallo-hydrolase [Nakamurella silvestris]|nr:M20/M25/M40 family metallo-hydrolase [Nakamurella silvestris]
MTDLHTTDLDDTAALDLLSELVAIDSSNPDLVPGAAGETAIADHVGSWLADRGFTVHRLEARPGRPSIVAVAAGTGGGRSIMLNGHLDTVTLAGYDGDPLTPELRDGKLFGRGTYDMKSGLAASMVAAARAVREPLPGDVILTLVADEEYASAGTEEVLQQFSADGAIVVEPSGLELTLAHRGFVWLDVTVEGVAAHGSRPDLGVDAITLAGRFLVRLGELQDRLAGGPRHPTLDTGSVHASVISGGEELSSYPARCTISIERRTVPGETAAVVEGELREILDDLAGADPTFRYSLTTGLERMPFEAPRKAGIVRTMLSVVPEVTGQPAVIRGEPFWTDCALLAEAGIPCVLFGVDGGGAHAAVEWVDLDSYAAVISVLTRAITDFCS